MRLTKLVNNQNRKIMKNLLVHFALLAVACLGAVSCSEKEEPEKPADEDPTPDVESVIVLDTNAVQTLSRPGTYSIGYTIESPVPDGEIEAVSPEPWVNTFVYDTVARTISFNVDQNMGGDREVGVSVIYSNAAEPALFTVKQPNPTKVLASELEDSFWKATICEFDRVETKFNEVNPEYHGELWSNCITAGEFADQYALDHNMANPDNPISPDDALGFEYVETDMLTTFYEVTIVNGEIDVTDGQKTPAGQAGVVRVYGKYEYDEDTGIMVVEDIANETYTREVTYEIKRDGDFVLFRCLKTWWPDYNAEYFGDQDRFGFVLSNYDGSKAYMPYGYLLYKLVPRIIVEEDPEEGSEEDLN